MKYVFVYGTLKRNHGNHHVLGNSEFIGQGITTDSNYDMYNGGFPFVDFKEAGGSGRIIGEIYKVVDDHTSRRLDMLEGVPHLYVHHTTKVESTDNGEVYDCLMYVASDSSRKYLERRERISPALDANLLSWPANNENPWG